MLVSFSWLLNPGQREKEAGWHDSFTAQDAAANKADEAMEKFTKKTKETNQNISQGPRG